MLTSSSPRPGRSARSRKWSSCSTRSMAGTHRWVAWFRSKRVLKSRSKSAVSGSGRIRRAMVLTSRYEEIVTARQSRYLSGLLSTSHGDKTSAGRRQLVRGDQVLLRAAKARREVPAVHVRPARERAEREPGPLQVVAHERDRVQVVAQGPHERLRRVVRVAARELALADPPCGGALIEARHVELVDHHRAVVAKQGRQAHERLAQRLDMVQRDHCDRRV